MTDTTDHTIAAQTEQGAVIIAEVTHTDLTERDTTGHGTIEHIDPNEIQVEAGPPILELDGFKGPLRRHGDLRIVAAGGVDED